MQPTKLTEAFIRDLPYRESSPTHRATTDAFGRSTWLSSKPLPSRPAHPRLS